MFKFLKKTTSRRMVGQCLAAIALMHLGSAAAGLYQADGFVFSPYKHLNTAVSNECPIARTEIDGVAQALITAEGVSKIPNLKAVTLAFASGECGDEHWGNLQAQRVADANLKPLVRAGIDYLISTGGEGHVFTCGSDTGMARFIARYQSPRLLGFDFDIESGQSKAALESLVQRLKVVRKKHPKLRTSFTLATFAASDGSGASLNATGDQVMQLIAKYRLRGVFINLMVMDFGPALAKNCVVRDGACDMNASAQQAVVNFRSKYKVPPSRIELTPMIGINDVVENRFTLENARDLARFVKQNHLGGLHYWSLDRDKPCQDQSVGAFSTCSGINDVPANRFMDAMLDGLR
jgi:hypothetical protein